MSSVTHADGESVAHPLVIVLKQPCHTLDVLERNSTKQSISISVAQKRREHVLLPELDVSFIIDVELLAVVSFLVS